MATKTAPKRKAPAPAEDSSAFGPIAERFRRAGEFDRAVSLCRDGLRKFPNHVSARVTLGWALLESGKLAEARVELEQVLQRAPDNLAAIRGLAELHDRMEHTLNLPMDGPGQWPPDAASLDESASDSEAPTDAIAAPPVHAVQAARPAAAVITPAELGIAMWSAVPQADAPAPAAQATSPGGGMSSVREIDPGSMAAAPSAPAIEPDVRVQDSLIAGAIAEPETLEPGGNAAGPTDDEIAALIAEAESFDAVAEAIETEPDNEPAIVLEGEVDLSAFSVPAEPEPFEVWPTAATPEAAPSAMAEAGVVELESDAADPEPLADWPEADAAASSPPVAEVVAQPEGVEVAAQPDEIEIVAAAVEPEAEVVAASVVADDVAETADVVETAGVQEEIVESPERPEEVVAAEVPEELVAHEAAEESVAPEVLEVVVAAEVTRAAETTEIETVEVDEAAPQPAQEMPTRWVSNEPADEELDVPEPIAAFVAQPRVVEPPAAIESFPLVARAEPEFATASVEPAVVQPVADVAGPIAAFELVAQASPQPTVQTELFVMPGPKVFEPTVLVKNDPKGRTIAKLERLLRRVRSRRARLMAESVA
jgi:hypothetical protein